MPKGSRGPLPEGKVPAALLARLLRGARRGRRVVLGPAVGEDAAVLRTRAGRLLVAASDPVTFASEESGFYAVAINANDVATRGAAPLWFLATILLPAGRSAAADAKRLFGQIRRACRSFGVELVGGHTEAASGIDKPLICGTMLGEVEERRLVTCAGMRPGDHLVLAKSLGLEGASILARERAAVLRRRVPEAALARARRFTRRIGVVEEALAAVRLGRVRAMHDPTEGGVAGALHELADRSGVGLLIEEANLPVRAETLAICEALFLDPLGLISSGCLLIACDPRDSAKIVAGIRRRGVEAAVVGHAMPRSFGRKLVRENKKAPLPRFPQDEIVRGLDPGARSLPRQLRRAR